MEYRTMKHGETPSLLGFGCMRFPTLADGSIDEEKAEALLDHAIENGVTYIDTAYPYHNQMSEPFVGKVLKKYKRDAYYLATKLPLWDVKTLDDVKEMFQKQLDRLDQSYVDFYLLHAMDKEKWELVKRLGIIPYLEQEQQAGRIRNLGFSFHDEYEVFEEILTARDWDFCQIQLNYMDVEHQQGIRGYYLAQERGVPIVIMEPNKGGALANLPADIESIFRAYDPDASMASWAFRWIASLSNVKVVLSGMTMMAQVVDNLSVFHAFKPLNHRESILVEEAAKAIRAKTKNGCTGCNYCMPCPFGVDIPRNFKIWNTYAMYENKEQAANGFQSLDRSNAFASVCKKCGACENKCPQHLPIRAHLEQVAMDRKTWGIDEQE